MSAYREPASPDQKPPSYLRRLVCGMPGFPHRRVWRAARIMEIQMFDAKPKLKDQNPFDGWAVVECGTCGWALALVPPPKSEWGWGLA